MARLISVEIEYCDKTYFALVSVRQNEGEITCQVRYADSALHDIVSGNILVLDTHGKLKNTSTSLSERSRLLINNTVTSISRQLSIG